MDIRWKLVIKITHDDESVDIDFPTNGFTEYESIVELLFRLADVAVKTNNGDQIVMYSLDKDTGNRVVVPDVVYWQFFFSPQNNQPVFTSSIDPSLQPNVTAMHHWCPQNLVDVYNAFVAPAIVEIET